MMKTLLLSCCAPCSCAVIEKMSQEKRDFAVLFYNPNIFPREEYQKRCIENQTLCKAFNVDFFSLDYDPESWLVATKGFENTPERGARCEACFKLRFQKTVEFAKKHGFDTVTSVLGISRHKNFDQVTKIALHICTQAGLVYDDTNWRKGGLEERRQRIVKEMGLYKQNYCGCGL